MHDSVDVLILGAGPAGSSLAARLASGGFQVAIADRKRFPRAKPCGEFLSPDCVPILEELGVAAPVLELGARSIAGMRLFGYARHAVGRFRDVGNSVVPYRGGGLAVRRETLDAELLRAAELRGAGFLERWTARSLLRDDSGRVAGARLSGPEGAEREVRARFTVGADGIRSTVARELGVLRRIGWLDKFALATRYRGVPERSTAEVHMFPGGYFAATPVEQGLFSVNLVVDRVRLADRSNDWDGFFANYLQRTPEFAERLSAAVRVDPIRGVGPLAWTTDRQVAPGVALVGDACGYVDPITGEGIWFALRGAELLADALSAGLHAPARAEAELARYARRRRNVVGPRLWMARMLQRGLRSEAVARRVLGVLAARPGLADLLVSVTGDYVRAVDLLRPRVWSVAWRRGDRAA